MTQKKRRTIYTVDTLWKDIRMTALDLDLSVGEYLSGLHLVSKAGEIRDLKKGGELTVKKTKIIPDPVCGVKISAEAESLVKAEAMEELKSGIEAAVTKKTESGDFFSPMPKPEKKKKGGK